MALRGLLTDWGGVLTTPLTDAIGAWAAAERIDLDVYRTVMLAWLAHAYDTAPAGDGVAEDGRADGVPPVNPVHGLEEGTLDPREFERRLAAELRTIDGDPVACDGLLERMFSAFAPVEPMYDALRKIKQTGLRTGLLSNSWGNSYPRELWTELFDIVVISAEVGMRKPDERIFRHALEGLGLEPHECVFIDDIEHNIRAAEAIGMVGLHHTDPIMTVSSLEGLLGVRL